MAYINAKHVSQIRNSLKNEFPNFKFSVRKDQFSEIIVTIKKGNVDFSDILNENNTIDINVYHLRNYKNHEALLQKIINVIKTGSDNKWYDKSDMQSDYFNIAFYITLKIGDYDHPYQMI